MESVREWAAEPPLRIILVEPEIPPNTGNIARLCGATRCQLYLVGKLGFELSDRTLKRAGLDYWRHVYWHHVNTLDEALLGAARPPWLFSTRGRRFYFHARFAPGDCLVYGCETRGLSSELLARWPEDQCLRIPMPGPVRSINLSSAVALTAYEALRQIWLDHAAP
ncbi:MAG: tRNA (cytidine(34)-2'-O)-methyltransferase [Myxococcota bacterium]|nr:tRNA (cytidine(34)-2'-O)-methyltransferase [Myxococcota bacterium]